MFSRVRRCCGACGLGKRRDRPCVADAPRKTPILNPYRVFFCGCLCKQKRRFLQNGSALPAPVPVSPWPVSPWPDALRPLASCGYLSRGWLHLGFFPGCFGAFFLLWFSSMGRRLDCHGSGSLHRFLGCLQALFERGRPWLLPSPKRGLSTAQQSPYGFARSAAAGRSSKLQGKPGFQRQPGRQPPFRGGNAVGRAARIPQNGSGAGAFAWAKRTAAQERSHRPSGRDCVVFFIFTFFFGRFMVY